MFSITDHKMAQKETIYKRTECQRRNHLYMKEFKHYVGRNCFFESAFYITLYLKLNYQCLQAVIIGIVTLIVLVHILQFWNRFSQ